MQRTRSVTRTVLHVFQSTCPWVIAAIIGAAGMLAASCSTTGQTAPSALATPSATQPPAPVTAQAPASANSAAPAASASAPKPIASTSASPEGSDWPQVPDVVYVPTPQNVVDKMLQAVAVKPTDVVYDLGCGDGRILVTAAKRYGVKAVGFDVDPKRIAEAQANVKKAHVEHLVTIEQKNIFDVDLSPATVVTLYLLPELNVRLIPQLEKLKDGARVVSHDFDMEGVPYLKTWTLMAPDHADPHKLREHYVYLWRAPIRRSASP